jgi:hypothetical protein
MGTLLERLQANDRVRLVAVDLTAVNLQPTFSAADGEATAAAMQKLEARVPSARPTCSAPCGPLKRRSTPSLATTRRSCTSATASAAAKVLGSAGVRPSNTEPYG